MRFRWRLSLLILAGTLTACQIPFFPTTEPAPPPSPEEFTPIGQSGSNPGTPSGDQAPDPFNSLQDMATTTKFAPTLAMSLSSKKAGEEPSVTLNIYQTKEELEIKETQTLIENASFIFAKLSVDQEVGTGTMEVGTPPKMTLDVSIKVASTDNKETAMLTVKGENDLVRVYIADLQIKKLPEGLSIISIGNLARSNNKQGTNKTAASARIIQTLSPGFVHLPDTAGPMRVQTAIISEVDTPQSTYGQKVFRETITIE